MKRNITLFVIAAVAGMLAGEMIHQAKTAMFPDPAQADEAMEKDTTHDDKV